MRGRRVQFGLRGSAACWDEPGSLGCRRSLLGSMRGVVLSQQEAEGAPLRVVFIPVQRDRFVPDIVAGNADVAVAGLTVTPEREQQVAYVPYEKTISEVVVHGADAPPLASLDDLSGRSVFVHRSSSYYLSLVALSSDFERSGRRAIDIVAADENLETEDILDLVNAGVVPITLCDLYLARTWAPLLRNLRVRTDLATRTGAQLGPIVRKQSPQLKAALDDFTTRHNAKTAEVNRILTRYLKNTKYVKDAASKSQRKKFLALVEYFQKYGDKYHVDWLLMAAQGYQESQLNQAARSPVGAIGVMQVMPATGADLRVGDITQTEPNIHAGVKYMRWMIDEHYGQEPMTQLDKALFAFASYNAGARRISQLRIVAAKRGLDPNVWFDNVEYVAAERIGAETVTYVSNIYKYYIAYRLIMEARADREEAIGKMKGQNKSAP
jgi:membrane-bound lytic murein transglycosylase MltF